MEELVPTDAPVDEMVYIFNPTKEDFTTTFVIDDGEKKTYTLQSYEGKEYPKVVANHIAKHLKDEIVAKYPVVTEKEIADAYRLIFL